MNLLSNKWVVGALAVIALAVVWFQVVQPHMPHSSPAPQSPQASSPVLPPASTAAQPSIAASTPHIAGTNLVPEDGLNRTYIASNFSTWFEAPQHDPFQMQVSTNSASGTTNSPVASWKLKGIWRQTGSRLAAINKGIYAEGDEIEGYKLEKIEDDQVVFQGPSAQETLSFAPLEGGTNQPPPHL
jgi:hypothetical protein